MLSDLLYVARTIAVHALMGLVHRLRPEMRSRVLDMSDPRGDFYAEWPASERDAWPTQEMS